MTKIFISYRREDSADFSGRLHDRLLEQFGEQNVFRDIDDIQPGDKFARIIADRIAECSVVVAVIGNSWIRVTDLNGKRRIDDEEDYVRAEICEALKKDKVIVPVLVQRAPMPRRKLELEQIDRDWINELPGAPPKPGEAESELVWVDSKQGRNTDHYKQIRLPWLIIATVDAYPNGTLWERARALYRFERALEQTSLREAHSHPDNWWRAELLYALNYLQARVSQ